MFEKILNARDITIPNPLISMHNCPQRRDSENKWSLMIEQAKKLEPEFAPPTIPYIDSHVVGLHNLNGIILHSNNLIPPN